MKRVTIFFSGTVVVDVEDDQVNDDGVYRAWLNRVSDADVVQDARMTRWWETVPGAAVEKDGRGRRKLPYSEAEVRSAPG